MQQSKIHVHTTENRCMEIFTAETFRQWDFASLSFHGEGCPRSHQSTCEARVRAEKSETPWFSYWCCSFLIHPPPFNYPFSSLFQLSSTQGNEFSYEVKYELYREWIIDLLLHGFYNVFSQKNGFVQISTWCALCQKLRCFPCMFVPDECRLAGMLKDFLNLDTYIFLKHIYQRNLMDWVHLQRRCSKSRQKVETAINSRVGWFDSHVIITFLMADCTSQENVRFCIKIDVFIYGNCYSGHEWASCDFTARMKDKRKPRKSILVKSIYFQNQQ